MEYYLSTGFSTVPLAGYRAWVMELGSGMYWETTKGAKITK
jgi:hypothetical protein